MLKTVISQLDRIRKNIISLGDYSIQLNISLLQLIQKNDYALKKKIDCLSKNEIQSRAVDIDNDIVTALSLYAPEARDLRELVAFLKITNEFVRTYCNTRSFIKDFPVEDFRHIQTKRITKYFLSMHERTTFALQMALNMISIENETEVKNHFQQIYQAEKQTDKTYKLLTKELLKIPDIESNNYIELLELEGRIEKVADRALYIASLIYYARLGGNISQEIEID